MYVSTLIFITSFILALNRHVDMVIRSFNYRFGPQFIPRMISINISPYPVENIRIGNLVSVAGEEVMNYMKGRSNYITSPLIDSNLFRTYIRKLTSEKMVTDLHFANMIKVRELRKRNSKSLSKIESNLINCRQELLSHPNYPELALLDKDIAGK